MVPQSVWLPRKRRCALTHRNSTNEFVDAINKLPNPLDPDSTGPVRVFSARDEFPDAWHRFLHPPEGEDHVLTLDIDRSMFPYRFQGAEITVKKMTALAMLEDSDEIGGDTSPKFSFKVGAQRDVELSAAEGGEGVLEGSMDELSLEPEDATITVSAQDIDGQSVREIVVSVGFGLGN